jgi:hypothetical protein
MRRIVPAMMLALAACAPLPKSEVSKLSAQGIRPGVASAEGFDKVSPPLGQPFRYEVISPLRDVPSELAVTLRRDAAGGYLREEIVRIPETTEVEARIVASMVNQRDGRSADVVGTDVILHELDRIDNRGRTLSSDRGAGLVTYDPHDCRATPGTCRMARTGPDGEPIFLVVDTSELGGIWRSTVRHDAERDPASRGALVEETIYSVDENAVLIDMNRMDHEKDLGQYQEIRRID